MSSDPYADWITAHLAAREALRTGADPMKAAHKALRPSGTPLGFVESATAKFAVEAALEDWRHDTKMYEAAE